MIESFTCCVGVLGCHLAVLNLFPIYKVRIIVPVSQVYCCEGHNCNNRSQHLWITYNVLGIVQGTFCGLAHVINYNRGKTVCKHLMKKN